MKPLYRLTYLLLSLIGSIIFLILVFADPLIWAFTGKSPACRFVDYYFGRVDRWKKGRRI